MIQFLLFAAPAFAAFNPGACPSVAELSAKIKICSENKQTAVAARACAAEMRKSWKEANHAFQLGLAASRAKLKGSQEKSVETSNFDYKSMEVTIATEIERMQKYTALIASYPQAMLDFEDAVDDDTSATCFNESFNELQKLVKELDKEIISAKAAHKVALGLVGSTAARDASLGGVAGSAGVGAAGTKGAGAGSVSGPKGPKAPRDSDVSGIQEDKAKQQKVDSIPKSK